MLNNPDENNLSKSFTNLITSKPCQQERKQNKIIENKTQNSAKDTKNNRNSNLNSSYLKTFTVFSETNCDSNCITDRSFNNLREIKVKIISTKRKNNYIINNNNNRQNNSNNDYNIKDIQSFKEEEEKNKKIIEIQNKSKTNYQIIFIQKIIRGFLLRKHMSNIILFIKCIFKLIFKKVFNEIKHKNKLKYTIKKELKKSTEKTIRKHQTNARFNKKIRTHNSRPLLSESNYSSINSKVNIHKNDNKKLKVDLLKKFTTNNSINMSKTNILYTSVKNNNNNNKAKIFNKNKKNNKEKKEKENVYRNISSKDKIIANNIFNIYDNIKKYYKNDKNNFNNNINNNNNYPDKNNFTVTNFYPKKQINSIVKNNDNKSKIFKSKNLLTRGSMKNINEGKITYRNSTFNIKNSKTDRNYSYRKDNGNFIVYLLKLKKAFLFWRSYLMKKKILQKMKFIKNIKTPDNTKKTLSIYSTKKKEDTQINKIITKKINLSNSLLNIKLKKISPNKAKIDDNSKQNIIFKNYIKIKEQSNSVENNYSTVYSKVPESRLNRSLNVSKGAIIEAYNRNKYRTNICNNSVIVISQYDRNNEKTIKKNSGSKNKKEVINKFSDSKYYNKIDINENKKIYLFYAIINLIDMHNKRKKIKNYFHKWKTLTRCSRSYTINNKIEEKIISFKMIKPHFKNNYNTNQKIQNNPLNINDNIGNFSCQTEACEDINYCQGKENQMLNMQDLKTPNPLEKSKHRSLFKSNLKTSNIIYRKKVLLPNKNKMRNQSARSINSNNSIDEKEERNINMTLLDNTKEYNILNQSVGHRF